jgi:hypothetical protein
MPRRNEEAVPLAHAPRGRTRGSERFERDVACVVVFTLALLGPGLILSGLARLADAAERGPRLDAQRAAKFASFNASLRAWELVRPQWLRLPIRLAYQLHLSNASRAAAAPNGTAVAVGAALDLPPQYVDLVARADQEKLPSTDMPAWQPLAFRGTAAALAPPQPGWQPTRLQLDVEVKSGKGWARVAHAEVNWTTMAFTRSASWKDCINLRHGAYAHGWCTVYRVLTSLCAVVNLAARPGGGHPAAVAMPTLHLSTSDGHCRASSAGRGGLVYRTATPPHGRSGGVPGSTPLGPLAITLRASEDPLLAASRLTNGTMLFGPTQHGERSAGVLLLGLGVLLCLPPIGLACARGAAGGEVAEQWRQRWWSQRVPTSEPAGLAMVQPS